MKISINRTRSRFIGRKQRGRRDNKNISRWGRRGRWRGRRRIASRCCVFDFSANEDSDSRSPAPTRVSVWACRHRLPPRQSFATSGSPRERISRNIYKSVQREEERSVRYSSNKSVYFKSAATPAASQDAPLRTKGRPGGKSHGDKFVRRLERQNPPCK